MALPQYLIAGFDPTADPDACITRAQLLQLIEASKPMAGSGIGFTITADAAPDVVTYPELANFFWLKSVAGVRNGEMYYYNGTSWTLLSIVDGSLLANNSVPLAKLSGSGAAALYIIQRNALNTAQTWVSIPNAVQNNTIGVEKLLGAAAGNYILVSINGVNFFTTVAALAGLIPAAGLTINQVGASGGAAFQVLRRNSGNTGWQWYIPAQIDKVSEVQASGTAGGTFTAGAWRTRVLNTISTPGGFLLSLVANQITVNVGATYVVRFRAPGQGCGNHKAKLVRITPGPVDLIIGSSCQSGAGATLVSTDSVGQDTIVLAAGDVLELQHQCSSTLATIGFGGNCSFGVDEIYSEITFMRLK